MDLTCEQLEVLLPEMMDGRLSPDEEEGAAAHLATCDNCRVVVDGTNRVRTVAKEQGWLMLPYDARERIRRLLQ